MQNLNHILAEKDLMILNDWFLQALSCESVESFAVAISFRQMDSEK